jgi:protease I
MAGQLTGKKVVIIVANEFEDIELLYPMLRLSEEGAEIVVAPVRMGLHPRPSLEGKPVTGRFGHPVPIPVMPEGNRYELCRVEELGAGEIDCLLFPGGFSPDALRRHAGTLELVRACHQRGKVLAAICHGPWVLISAGVMERRRATGFAALRDDRNS